MKCPNNIHGMHLYKIIDESYNQCVHCGFKKPLTKRDIKSLNKIYRLPSTGTENVEYSKKSTIKEFRPQRLSVDNDTLRNLKKSLGNINDL